MRFFLLFFFQLVLQLPLLAETDSPSPSSTVIVTYQTDEKGKERIDRIRFWLKQENQKPILYPKGIGYSDNSAHHTRKVVIEDLNPGDYTLEFLIPNNDNLFAEIPVRSFNLAPSTLLRINQEIKLRAIQPITEKEVVSDETDQSEISSSAQEGYQLIIVRHGQSDHNINKIFNSEMNHPNYRPSHLTETGKEQVRKTAKILLSQNINKDSISLVLVSPFPRTLETAAILEKEGVFNPEVLFLDGRLGELRMGEKEGTSFLLPHDYVEAHSYGGETLEDLKNRVIALLNEIKKEELKGHILLVTHRYPAEYILNQLTDKPKRLKVSEAIILPLENLSREEK